jgi:UDP-glucose 4-epimerase
LLEALYRVVPDAKEVVELEVGEQPHEPINEYLDISRVREDLGWRPNFTIDAMLDDYTAWMRSNEY